MKKNKQNSYINNIRAERVRAGKSQREMAKSLGMSTNCYNFKETGKRQFTLPEFILICELLKKRPEDILTEPS